MVLKFALFFKELSLFLPAMLLGSFIANRHARFAVPNIGERVSFSWPDILIVAVAVVVFYLIMSKFHKVRSALLYVFFGVSVLIGSEIVFSAFWTPNTALGLSVIFFLAVLIVRNVFSHNLAMVLSIVGVSTLIGIGLDPFSAVALLVVFSFYDIAAVYWTRHMVTLAKGMIESGVIFGFIIPKDISGFMSRPSQAKAQMGDQFMILGSGDSGLPLILITSVAAYSLWDAIIVSFFACAGLFLTHILFINQHTKRAMAALPPIAMMTILGYLITYII